MGLSLHTGFVRLEYIEEDLIRFFDEFDQDVTGKNGPENLMKETVQGGFSSDIEYLLDLFTEPLEPNIPMKKMEKVLQALADTYDRDNFIGAKYSLYVVGNFDQGSEFIVSFAYASK